MNLNNVFVVFLLGACQLVIAQDKTTVKDSLDTQELEEVVVTGQINKTNVDKSVFEVSVITRSKIDQMAGNNLADILNQSLNISITPNATTGKSGVELFGLDGQYFKILVDNIPLINDEGLGNNTDLTQINLDDIAQIEIVEGSMGVQYGSNAVAGIINIITKKSSVHDWEINTYIQEETVHDEYALFNEGRHIQSVKVGHKINQKWYATLGFTRNDFAGYFNDKKGEYHELADGKRGHEWLPKLQYATKALVRFNQPNLKAFYRLEYFNENISRYDSIVRLNLNSATQTTNPIATDEKFTSSRWVHHLNLQGRLLQKLNYDFSASYQEQKREIEQYSFRIKPREKFDINDQEYESRKALYSRGTLTNFFPTKSFSFQLGYEINNIQGFSSALAGSFDGENIERTLESYDVFSTAEIPIGDRFSMLPGVRVLFSSLFKTQAAYSLSSKYAFDNGYQLRMVIGSAPRNPNYDELFTYFVDVNHDLRGNDALSPEKGFSSFLHLKKSFSNPTSDFRIKSKISAWYLEVKDRIELTIVNRSPLAYKYNNIDQYKTIGTSFNSSFSYSNVQLELGVAFSGKSKTLNSQVVQNNDYLFATKFNASLNYFLPKYHSTFSIFYKYNGPEDQFVLDNNDEGNFFSKNELEGYGWLDAAIKTNFLDNSLQVSVGARNLLNITRINTVGASGLVHSTPNQGLLLGYGRSYFLKLLYNLTF